MIFVLSNLIISSTFSYIFPISKTMNYYIFQIISFNSCVCIVQCMLQKLHLSNFDKQRQLKISTCTGKFEKCACDQKKQKQRKECEKEKEGRKGGKEKERYSQIFLISKASRHQAAGTGGRKLNRGNFLIEIEKV